MVWQQLEMWSHCVTTVRKVITFCDNSWKCYHMVWQLLEMWSHPVTSPDLASSVRNNPFLALPGPVRFPTSEHDTGEIYILSIVNRAQLKTGVKNVSKDLINFFSKYINLRIQMFVDPSFCLLISHNKPSQFQILQAWQWLWWSQQQQLINRDIYGLL